MHFGIHISNIYGTVACLILMTLLMQKASDILGDALSKLGLKLKISNSVRGATFDAVSSSIPELLTALIAVFLYHQFDEIGFATVAGSGIFNILLIPMLSIIVFKGASSIVSIDKKSVWRDAIFYLICLLILLGFFYIGVLNWITGICLIALYCVYIMYLRIETLSYRETAEFEKVDDSFTKLVLISLLCVIGIFVMIESIVFSATVVSTHFGIPQYIISLIILAGCTSIPDTLLSVRSSRNGDMEGSVANAVGSNIFDLSVCIGLPLLLYGKSIKVDFIANLPLFAFLFGSVVVTMSVLLQKKLKKISSIAMGIFYLIFLAYVIVQAF